MGILIRILWVTAVLLAVSPPLLAQDYGKIIVEASRGESTVKGSSPLDQRIEEEKARKKDEEKPASSRSATSEARFTPRATESRGGSAREAETRSTPESSGRGGTGSRDGSDLQGSAESDLRGKAADDGRPEALAPDASGNSENLSRGFRNSPGGSTPSRSRSTPSAAGLGAPTRMGAEKVFGEPTSDGTRQPGRESPASRDAGRNETGTTAQSLEKTGRDIEKSLGRLSEGAREDRVAGKSEPPEGGAHLSAEDSSGGRSKPSLFSIGTAGITLGKGARKSPGTTLDPRVETDYETALTRARSREQALVIAVGIAGLNHAPEAFRSSPLARASRVNLCLISLDASAAASVAGRTVPADRIPCYAVADSLGNVTATFPVGTDPSTLLLAARNAQAIFKSIREEAPNILSRARERAAAGDEAGLLALARPWLVRRYRGNPDLDQVAAMAAQLGALRLEKAGSAGSPEEIVAALRKLTQDFVGTPVEGVALLELARRLDREGKRDEARAVLKQITDTLSGPEHEETLRQTKAFQLQYRKEDVQRRLEEMERRKKLEQERKK